MLVGDRIYACSEKGEMYVFRSSGEGYVQLAKNQLGDMSIATPTPADGRLYHRYSKAGQEFLVAIGR